jgi:hypothetical protein
VGTFSIVNAQLDPIRIAEIEFVQVRLQMVLAAMLVNANHATLEDTEKAPTVFVVTNFPSARRTYSSSLWFTAS